MITLHTFNLLSEVENLHMIKNYFHFFNELSISLAQFSKVVGLFILYFRNKSIFIVKI